MALRRESLSDVGLLWLRVLMGAGIAFHGAQLMGLFTGSMKFSKNVVTAGLPFSEGTAWVAALLEVAVGVLVALGLATRVIALLVFFGTSVTVFVTHAADAYAAKELALAYWTMSGALVMTGPGGISLDAVLAAKLRRGKPKRRA